MITVQLLAADRDLDLDATVPPGVADTERDLELPRLWDAMADGDDFLRDVARAVVLHPLGSAQEVGYRQDALADCLRAPEQVAELYDFALRAQLAGRDDLLFGLGRTSPDALLRRSVRILQKLLPLLAELRQWTQANATTFPSAAFQRFFRGLAADLPDEYLADLEHLLRRLELRQGLLLSAAIGPLGAVTGTTIRTPRDENRHLLSRVPLARPVASYTIPERDQAGFDALSELEDRALDGIANAAAQALDHVLGFFAAVRREVAFFLGAINLTRRLRELSVAQARPEVQDGGPLEAHGLVDPCLALRASTAPVGNDLALPGDALLVITGANRGGKSTFLRALGVAQLMAQAGLPTAADSLRIPCVGAVLTHWSREEDDALEHGKLDEELDRMARLAEQLRPGDLLLSNESFSSTNESEGSDIGEQVMTALLDAGVQVRLVTHLFDLASRLRADRPDAVFLRAPRSVDGEATFRLERGDPRPTSFGVDLFDRTFGTHLAERPAASAAPS
ncbi:MutS-related protein [Amnibacterium sp.]|uniref:MutS-related protein n=1 Tax=Amnibacterium sp. TaxID=1872496 RepID=UPI003F7CB65E